MASSGKTGLVVWAILIGVVLLATGMVKLPGLSVSGLAVGPTANTAVSPNSINGQPITSNNIAPVLGIAAYWIDPTTGNKETQVATNSYYELTQVSGSKTILDVGQTKSTGFNVTTSGFAYGVSVRGIVGDGGTNYYYGASDPYVIIDPARYLGGTNGILTFKSGAPTVYVVNETGAQVSKINETWSGGSGGTMSVISLKLSAPTGGAYYGDQGYADCFTFSSANFTTIYPAGYVKQVTITTVKPTSLLDKVQCFAMPGVLYNGALVNVGLNLQAKSGITPTQSGIDFSVVDYTRELFASRLLDPAYESASGASTDIGKSTTSTTSLIYIQ